MDSAIVSNPTEGLLVSYAYDAAPYSIAERIEY